MSIPNCVDKIFIIHYTKLTDRREHMEREMGKWFPDTPVEFVEVYDQEDLDPLHMIDNFDMQTFRMRFAREMKPGEASLSLKFKEVFRKISEEEPGEHFLVLEDDVIFKEDPVVYITNLLDRCEQQNIDFDCVFMGEAAIRVGDNRDIFMKKDHPATNGLCTVLYKKEAVRRLHKHLQATRNTQPMDWELNDRFKALDFTVYWAKAITAHGSVLAVHDERLAGLRSTLRDKY